MAFAPSSLILTNYFLPLNEALGLNRNHAQHMEWIDKIKPLLDLLNGLVSPFLAITVAYIAYQQWKTNQRRENREQRAIQVSIYKRVKSHLNYIDYNREVDPELFEEFKQASAEADFVFPETVKEYLADVESDSSQWLVWKDCLDTAAKDADQQSIASLEVDNENIMDKLQQKSCDLLNLFEKRIY